MEDEKKSRLPGVIGDLVGSGIGGVIPMLIDKMDRNKLAESAEEKRRREQAAVGAPPTGMKKGGKVKAKASSASKRADGCAQRGKTRGRFV